MQNEYRLSIITVNYNGFADTCALIESLPATKGMEIIVVDNGSDRDEAQLLHSRFPHVTTIRSEENLGFAGGNNLGIKTARGEYLFFINNDTEVNDNWHPELLIERMESESKIAIVCPKIRFAWGNYPIQFAGYTPLSPITLRNASIGFNETDHGQYNFPHSTPYAHGAAMLVKREALEHVGLMPECFFLYYEELDWSMMFRRKGYEIWYDPSCTIYHKESQATGQNSPLKIYYITRNRLLFAHRNIPLPKRILTYSYLIGIVYTRDLLNHLLHGRLRHAKATIRGVFHFLFRLNFAK